MELVQNYGINTIVTALQGITSDPNVIQNPEFDIKLVKKPRSKLEKLGMETVPTLAQASEKCGLPVDEIMTTRDIEIEFKKDRRLIQQYTRRGPHGEPHLTPLPVRLKATGGRQLLFWRPAVAEKVANPPKTGRPRK